ncbi:MAG: UDP-glucose/GDP-mannose dehydrogenase family protein [Candidatus Saganbacteria bacterium]|nr:UDP-glucose/GDP-mannose dehydrogenase family protein [Candidatus Saganbacteria bacterium]
MKLCVVGAGYVGLTTAACLAHLGHEVICVDKDKAKINKLNRSAVPFYEPGLSEVIKRAADKGDLGFTQDLADAVKNSKLIFIAVGTPQRRGGRANLNAVISVSREIRRLIKDHRIIVMKSTVPPGFSDKLKKIFAGRPVDIVSNPEFLREGTAVNDTLFPDRIVVGTDSESAAKAMRQLYAPIVDQTFPTDIEPRPTNYAPLILTDNRSAEMIKYASNAFLATKISFINEIAHLCELVGADITRITEGMGLDERIGPRFLKAGLGYGGSCFPKDTNALSQVAGDHGHDFKLLKAVIEVNNLQRQRFISKIKNKLKKLKGRTVCILGLAFKPHTDDLREAPALDIINWLLAKKARVRVYDPEALENTRKIFGSKIEYAAGSYQAVQGADALIIATEWQEFQELDLAKLRSIMKQPVIFDGRNLFDKKAMKDRGFDYISIGR